MPAQLTYPGVYIEEVPSGVRTITGVATSIAAFVGRAARGPVNDPVFLTSFGDFERSFGGLTRLSSLPFAVRDFFQNGGSQAIVVRLYNAGADPAEATIDANGLALRAASPGSWGNALRARVETGTDDVSPDLAAQWASEFPGIATSDLFNLIVRDTATGATEEYRNVTVVDSPRRIDTLLANQSRLVVTDGTPAYPTSSDDDPDPGEDIWADDTLSSPVDTDGSDGDALEEDDVHGHGARGSQGGPLRAREGGHLQHPRHPAVRRGRRGRVTGGRRRRLLRAAQGDAHRRPALGLGCRRGRTRQRRDGRHDEQERGALLPAHPPAERRSSPTRSTTSPRRARSPGSTPAPTRSGASGRRRRTSRSSARRRSACR